MDFNKQFGVFVILINKYESEIKEDYNILTKCLGV